MRSFIKKFGNTEKSLVKVEKKVTIFIIKRIEKNYIFYKLS